MILIPADDYRRVLWTVAERLEAAGVPYMLSGSTAMNFYGRPRMTRDLDIVLELRRPDVERLAALFEPDFSVDTEEILDAVRLQSMFNLIHWETVVKVDFIVRKNSAYRLEEFARRRLVEDNGHRVWVVAPEDLVLSKLYWARDSRSEFQLTDVRNLIASQPSLDWNYLGHWAEDLNIAPLLAEVRP